MAHVVWREEDSYHVAILCLNRSRNFCSGRAVFFCGFAETLNWITVISKTIVKLTIHYHFTHAPTVASGDVFMKF